MTALCSSKTGPARQQKGAGQRVDCGDGYEIGSIFRFKQAIGDLPKSRRALYSHLITYVYTS